MGRGGAEVALTYSNVGVLEVLAKPDDRWADRDGAGALAERVARMVSEYGWAMEEGQLAVSDERWRRCFASPYETGSGASENVIYWWPLKHAGGAELRISLICRPREARVEWWLEIKAPGH